MKIEKLYAFTPITDRILEGLEDEETYQLKYNTVEGFYSRRGKTLKIEKGWKGLAQILLPVENKEVSDEEIRKEAFYFNGNYQKQHGGIGEMFFSEGAKWMRSQLYSPSTERTDAIEKRCSCAYQETEMKDCPVHDKNNM